jgi:hypothetical protein
MLRQRDARATERQIEQLRIELVPVGAHEDGAHHLLARVAAAVVLGFVGHGGEPSAGM